MLINRARAFYERTASLRENRTTSYVFGLATIALALLARFILARQLVGFPFLVFFPAIFLSITVLAVNLLGDGLRDALDPRLAKRL